MGLSRPHWGTRHRVPQKELWAGVGVGRGAGGGGHSYSVVKKINSRAKLLGFKFGFTSYVTLSKSLHLPVPPFSHL